MCPDTHLDWSTHLAGEEQFIGDSEKTRGELPTLVLLPKDDKEDPMISQIYLK